MRQLTATGFWPLYRFDPRRPMKANCRWRWIHARRQKHLRNVTSRAAFPSSEFAAARSGEQLWKDAAADLQKRYDFLAQWPEKRKKATPIKCSG